MTERHYPEVTDTMLWPFKLVRQHLMEDPDYLTVDECPYSGEVKRFLSLLSQPAGDKPSAEDVANSSLDQEGLEANIKRVFNELTTYGQKLGVDDTSEKAAYFRLSTSLLEKLLTLQERAKNVQQINDFQNRIIKFMEDHCTPDQRTKLMDYLA
jgi:hypothetical protein